MSLLAGHAYVDIEPKLAAGFESKLSSAVGGATKAAGDLGSRNISAGLKNVGASISSVGGKLTKGVTLPLLAGGIAVTKFATDFGRGMGNVATLIPGNTKRVNELSGAVQKMAVETGKSTSDLTGGLYQVISAFGDTADTVGILRINAKAATAGVAETTDAINLTSAVTKAYGDTTAAAVQHTADLALNTVRLGQTTFPELAGSIGLVTPLAAALGIKVEDLFGTFATFTGVTGGAAEVSTQLRGVLQSLLAPTADMSSLFKTLGVDSGEALIKQRGLQGAVQAVVDASEKSGKPLQAYLSSIEAQTLALAGSAGQHDAWIQKNKEMAHVTGQTDKAFEALTTGIGKNTFQLDQAKAAAEVAAIKIGNALAPAVGIALRGFVPLASGIADTASALLTMEGPGGTAVRILGGIAIAAGPVLYVTGKLISGIGSLVGTLKTIKGGIDGFRVGLSGIETGLGGALPNKIGTLVANLGGLGALAGVIGATTIAVGAFAVGMSRAAKDERETTAAAEAMGKALVDGGHAADQARLSIAALFGSTAAGTAQAYANALLLGAHNAGQLRDRFIELAHTELDHKMGGVNASLGVFDNIIEGAANGARDQAQALGVLGVESAKVTRAQEGFARALKSGDEDRIAGARRNLTGASREQAEIQGQVDAATREGADAAKDLGGAMDDQAGATGDAATALDTYKTAIDNVLGINLDAISAGLAYRDAIAGLTAKIKDNGGSLDENTAKGRANTEAVIETTNKARDYASALVQQRNDTAGATFVLVGHANQLLAVAHQAGLTGQAAIDYTTRLLGIPHDAATNIHNTADIAAYFVALYKGKLDSIPPTKHTDVSVDVHMNDYFSAQFASVVARANNATVGVNTFGRPKAHGGIERATPGGVLIRVAEAGEDEAVIPLGRSLAATRDRERLLKQLGPLLGVPAAASGGIYQSGPQVATSPYQSGSATSMGGAEDDVLVVNSRGQVVPMWALKKGEHWTPLLNSGSRVGTAGGGRSLGPPKRTHRQVPTSSHHGSASTSAYVDPTVAILRRIEKVLVRSERALEQIAAKDSTLSIDGKAFAAATAKDTATALRRLEKARS